MHYLVSLRKKSRRRLSFDLVVCRQPKTGCRKSSNPKNNNGAELSSSRGDECTTWFRSGKKVGADFLLTWSFAGNQRQAVGSRAIRKITTGPNSAHQEETNALLGFAQEKKSAPTFF